MTEPSEKSYSKLEWLFYIVILPMLFTAILAGVFMSFLGYDIIGSLQKSVSSVPVIGQLVGDEQTEDAEPTAEQQKRQLEEQIVSLEEEIQSKELAIEELNIALEERNMRITDLEAEIKALNVQLEGKLAEQKAWEENMAELSQIYKTMAPNKAASIIANLSEVEAIHILNGMSSAERAKILEKMTTAKAASLTTLLTARPDAENEEVAVLLAKIDQLNSQLEAKVSREQRVAELATLYSNLAEDKAAEILAQMSNAEAVDILKQMTAAKRTAILAKMASDRAAQLTQLLLQ